MPHQRQEHTGGQMAFVGYQYGHVRLGEPLEGSCRQSNLAVIQFYELEVFGYQAGFLASIFFNEGKQAMRYTQVHGAAEIQHTLAHWVQIRVNRRLGIINSLAKIGIILKKARIL
jgi:hypothetical protein